MIRYGAKYIWKYLSKLCTSTLENFELQVATSTAAKIRKVFKQSTNTLEKYLNTIQVEY